MQQDSGFRRRMQDLSAAFCSLSDGIILLLLHLNADALCVLDPHLLPCTLLERPVSTVTIRCICPSESLLSFRQMILDDSYHSFLGRSQAIVASQLYCTANSPTGWTADSSFVKTFTACLARFSDVRFFLNNCLYNHPSTSSRMTIT